MSMIVIDKSISVSCEKKEKVLNELINSIEQSAISVKIVGLPPTVNRCPIIDKKLKELSSKGKVKFVDASSISSNTIIYDNIDTIFKFLTFYKI